LPESVVRRLRAERWLREHGWVVSGAYVVLALLLVFVLSRIDRAHPIGSIRPVERSAAEQLLGAIAAGMIAFTGIVFSISLLVAQFWNTAYSFRLMQWLRQTPLTAHAFGVFSATFVYALAALIALGRNPNRTFVLTEIGSIALLLASVLLFLLLLFGTLRQMSLSYVLALIGDRGREVIDDMYGEPGEGATDETGLELDGATESGRVVHRGAPRVVVAVDFRRLVELAMAANARIDIRVGVGDGVPDGAVLATVAGGDVPLERAGQAFLLGNERTMEQDPKFALRLLTDVAIKALSPAINDPTTAVQALDQTEDLLLRIGQRRLDVGSLVGEHGYTRVTYPAPTWDDLLAVGLDEIRVYGASSLQVVRRLRLVLQHLEEAVTPDRRPAVRERIERLDVATESEIAEIDRADALVGDPQGLGLSRAASGSATA
jgi:uncharacterized membrane protein